MNRPNVLSAGYFWNKWYPHDYDIKRGNTITLALRGELCERARAQEKGSGGRPGARGPVSPSGTWGAEASRPDEVSVLARPFSLPARLIG